MTGTTDSNRTGPTRIMVEGYHRPTVAQLKARPTALPGGSVDDITWPDGEGVELGNIRGAWRDVVQAVTRYAALNLRPRERVFAVTDDGLQAIVLLGFDRAPIVVTEPEDYLPHVIGITGGVKSDAAKVAQRIQNIIRIGLGAEPKMKRRSSRR